MDRIGQGLDQGLNQAALLAALVGGSILLLIIGVTVTNTGLFIADRFAAIIGHHVMGLSGYEDFVGLATGSAVLLLMPYCQAQRGHLAVDILAAHLPSALTVFLSLTWLVIMMLAVFSLGVALVFGLLEVRDDQAVSRVLGWPLWPFLVPGVGGLFLWAAICVKQLVTTALSGNAP
ncbi:MAG: TRAP transporter small permease subunit [Pseudomonadota bacterium]